MHLNRFLASMLGIIPAVFASTVNPLLLLYVKVYVSTKLTILFVCIGMGSRWNSWGSYECYQHTRRIGYNTRSTWGYYTNGSLLDNDNAISAIFKWWKSFFYWSEPTLLLDNNNSIIISRGISTLDNNNSFIVISWRICKYECAISNPHQHFTRR